MKDVVIPYRRTNSEELRYMLRSLKNVPHGNVYIIGDKPLFISDKVTYIQHTQTTDIARNTLSILNRAVNYPKISENFIWWADDIYCIKPVRQIPTYHRGTYEEALEKHQNRRFNYYVRRQIQTKEKLKSMGIANPLCYELHIPFTINKKKWLSVQEHITPALNKMSMYGNLCSIGGTKTKDVKVRTKDWIPKGAFASSHDTTFRTNSLGKLVRELFPDRSEYERN